MRSRNLECQPVDGDPRAATGLRTPDSFSRAPQQRSASVGAAQRLVVISGHIRPPLGLSGRAGCNTGATHASAWRTKRMESNVATMPRRPGALAVHSLHRFVFSVPDLREAMSFYRAFGLDVRETEGRLDLYTFGHPHRWGSIHQREGPKRFEYLSFGAYAEDFDALVQRLGRLGIATTKPHPLA